MRNTERKSNIAWAPTHPSQLHAILDQVTAGTLDNPATNRIAIGQTLVIMHKTTIAMQMPGSSSIPSSPDTVNVTLNKGANDLMLKVTQNNMPWGAVVLLREVRIVKPTLGEGFKLHTINAESRFEASGICDINKDGKLDIFSGGFWYEGPTWKKHFVREVQYDGNYHYDFADLPMDVDGDGWTDIVSAAYHNKKVFWVRNPGDSGGKFEVFDIDAPDNMETALVVDINGDGRGPA